MRYNKCKANTRRLLGSGFTEETIAIKAINKDGGFDKIKNADGTDSTVDKVFSYKITKDDTLESVINKINADSGVTVFFDETVKTIFYYG